LPSPKTIIDIQRDQPAQQSLLIRPMFRPHRRSMPANEQNV
jgi:hypothetical protein